MRASTGATPFLLVYRIEVVLPFEVEVPSLRILAESGLKEPEMALIKLPAKRSRKDTTREGSSATPQADMDFDKHQFQSAEHQ